jgi:cytochrome c-type biogenesis protein CcmH/NrfF
MRSVVRALVVGLLLVVASPVLAKPASQKDVEESLTCQCGCGLTVHSCNHIQCGSGEPIKKEVAERIARGETKEQILAAFQQKFGEKVLSSPINEGFNRLAWITPFAALALAGTILTVVIRRRAHATPIVTTPAGSPPAPDALRERLARELDAFDDES